MALTVNNIGNNSTSPRGLPTDMDNALQIYYGSVLTAFDRKQLFLDLVTTKSIEKSTSQKEKTNIESTKEAPENIKAESKEKK